VPQNRTEYRARDSETADDGKEGRRPLQYIGAEDVGIDNQSSSLVTKWLINLSWISSAQVATKMILLARTTPLEVVKKPSEGLSMFYIDFDKDAPGLDLRRIKKMGGRAIDANEVFFDNYRVPAETLIGKEGQGFKIVRTFAVLETYVLTIMLTTDPPWYER